MSLSKLHKPGILNGMTDAWIGADRERYRLTSQLAVFRSCPDTISRLLKKGGSVSLAAKVLVISRLLYNKLSEEPWALTYVEALRLRLGKLRQKLLASIDKRLRSVSIDSTALVDVLCAFSLAAKSSAAEILRHFLHVRSNAIVALIQGRDETGKSMLLALGLWIRTVQDTKDIFPRQLPQALLKLKAMPLFNSPDLRSIVEMDHDVHGEWISEDIRNFIPYIRHDDLQTTTVTQQTTTWASTTLVHYRDGVSKILESIHDLSLIVDLRRRTLELWFSNHNHVAGVDRLQVLDSLRNVFTARLLDLTRLECGSLSKITFGIRDIIQNWKENSPGFTTSIWDKHMTSMDILNGARPFIDTLQSGVYGRNDLIKKVLKEHRAWLERVELLDVMIEGLKKTKWEEDVDDVDEGDELSDERNHLLADADPQELKTGLSKALVEAYSNLQVTVDQLVMGLLSEQDQAPKATFLLRLLRELKGQRPPSMQDDVFPETSIQSLHKIVAGSVIETSSDKCRNGIVKAITRDGLAQRVLWEGTPELPILPSSWVFRLLQTLVSEMANRGSDLWSPQATRQLRIGFRTSFAQEVSTIVDSVLPDNVIVKSSSEETRTPPPAAAKGQEVPVNSDIQNSDDNNSSPTLEQSPNTSSSESKPMTMYTEDHITQLLFDLVYLDHATFSAPASHLSPNFPYSSNDKDADKDDLSRLVQKYKDIRTSHLAQPSLEKIQKSAREYWGRTKLLFALLEGGLG